jgi:hypothetical protein
VRTANRDLVGLTAGPDDALWFTEYAGNQIGRITTASVITEYLVPTAMPCPIRSRLGRMVPRGLLKAATGLGESPLPGSSLSTRCRPRMPYPIVPDGIAAGPDGALWFTEEDGNKIGRITTDGLITEYPLPTAKSFPVGITAGPDGALWFTDGRNKILQAVFVTASLTVSPASSSYGTSLTFTGSAFAPNERVRIYVSGIGSAVLATATADSSGSFTSKARQTQSPYGPRLFLGVGWSSGKLGGASFSVTPRLV